MRILMLQFGHLQPTPNAPEIGGAARQCLKLSKALVQQGVDVTILTNRIAWRDPTRSKIDDVPVVFINTGRPIFSRKGLRRIGIYAFVLCALCYLIRHRHEYDIIHAHSALTSGFIAVLAGRWLEKKSIIKVMNSGFRNDVIRFRNDKSLVGAGLMADYLRNCDRVIVLNPLAWNELLKLGFRSEQIELIPNGVEVEGLRAKTSYNGSDTTRLVYVGRLHQAKGIDTLLEALKILQSQQSMAAYQLTILGKGPLEQQLRAKTDTLGLTRQINFVGEVTNVLDHLFASDIFILPSRAEGISNALLEAMALGLPCLATDVAGNRVLIKNEQNGLLVKMDDALALGGAINRLANDCLLRRKLGQAARQTVEDQYDIIAVAARYISLYRKLLESPT
jgi:glycosyltransferase involved in cell wall biosynthesis